MPFHYAAKTASHTGAMPNNKYKEIRIKGKIYSHYSYPFYWQVSARWEFKPYDEELSPPNISIVKANPRAAGRVKRPKIMARPPKNSTSITSTAAGAGIFKAWAKKPMVPFQPKPPNQPRSFCAPWAKNTVPSATRKMKSACWEETRKSLSSIVPSCILVIPPFYRKNPVTLGSLH